MNFSKLLNISIEAAIAAGDKIMKIYNSDNFQISLKSDNSPLTIADKVSNETIKEFLKKTPYPILSEEEKEINFNIRKKWKILWIVDPIDGTKEFIKKNDEFTVNIALINNSVPVIGVVYAPATDEFYFSSKLHGSYKTDSKQIKKFYSKLPSLINNSILLPIVNERNEYIIVVSRSHLSDKTNDFIKEKRELKNNIKLISKGSSLKICLIAEGLADCYPRLGPTMEWDTAAGHCVCKYAGYELIDLKTNKEIKYNRFDLRNNSFLIENKLKG